MSFETVRAKNLYDSWNQLVDLVHEEGIDVSPRKIKSREVEDITIIYNNSISPISYTFENPIRRINPVFHLVELFYFLKGRNDDVLVEYNSEMKQFLNSKGIYKGSYGPTLHKGLQFALSELFLDKNTRRAVVPILATKHLFQKDIPCNVFISFRIRCGVLDFSVTTRSQDLYRGFLYDTLEFQLLQWIIAQLFKVKVGTYVHTINSLHIYKKDFDLIRKAVEWEWLTDPIRNRIKSPNIRFPNGEGLWSYIKSINKVIDLVPDHFDLAEINNNYDDIENAIYCWKNRFRYSPLKDPRLYTGWVNKWLDSRKQK